MDIESSADTFDFYGGIAAAVLQVRVSYLDKERMFRETSWTSPEEPLPAWPTPAASLSAWSAASEPGTIHSKLVSGRYPSSSS